jgi:RNA polymerase sigma-70 factor (ECF subfamily)
MTPRDPQFYLEHSGYVRSLARHIVFDEHLAADVEQQTWLAALEHAPRDANAARKWLKSLVRNFAIKAWLAEARRSKREDAASGMRAPVPTPDEILEHESARKRVVDALVALDEPYRSALTLRFFEGLEPREIAERLDLPVETVRTHVKRGLERLRARLQRNSSSRDGSKGAWSVALVRALRLEPLSYRAAAAAAAKSLIQGALVMGIANKALIGAGAVVALVAALLIVPRVASVEPQLSLSVAQSELDARATLDTPNVAPLRSIDERAAAPAKSPELASASALAPKSSSLLVRVTWWDKTPAAHVGLHISQIGAENNSRAQKLAETGADGTYRLDDALSGLIVVEPDRGGYGSTSLVPGESGELDIEVPRGADVDGLVTDERGAPVEAAEIFLHAERGPSYLGFVVARSDAAGRFAIRSVAAHNGALVSARKRGLAPTPENLLEVAEGAQVHVQLVFRAAGVALRGRVVDAQRRGIANAAVLLGDDDAVQPVAFPDGSRGFEAGAQLARTDEHGAFEFSSVAVGIAPIQARAANFAAWQGEVDSARTEPFEIVLEPSATLRGTVVDSAGNRIAGAVVSIGLPFEFSGEFVRTELDGSFVLLDVPLGPREIVAEGHLHRRARTVRTFHAGEEQRWDAVVSNGLSLIGHIVAPGRELSGFIVHAESSRDARASFSSNVETDADGRFEISDCPDDELGVQVFVPGDFAFAVASVERARAGASELSIEIDPAREPRSFFTGRVVGPDGAPIAGAELTPTRERGGGTRRYTAGAADARFQVGPLPDDAWWLEVRARGFAARRTQPRAVGAGETLDLGDIALEHGGTIAGHLSGLTRNVTWVQASRADGTWTEYLQVEDLAVHSGPLSLGRWQLTPIDDGGGEFAGIAVDVLDGVEVSAEIVARRP